MVYAVSYKSLAKSIGFLKFFLLLPFWTKIAFFKQIIVILSPILSSVTIGCRAHCVTLTFNSFHSFIHCICCVYSTVLNDTKFIKTKQSQLRRSTIYMAPLYSNIFSTARYNTPNSNWILSRRINFVFFSHPLSFTRSPHSYLYSISHFISYFIHLSPHLGR